MCHSDESRPPSPPVVGAVAEQGRIDVVSADGTPVSAYYCLPEGPARAGVVVLPDVRGLHPYYMALTERLAESGLAAVAIDLYVRTAGPALDGTRDDAFPWQSHREQTTPAQIDEDSAAAIDFLRTRTRDGLPVITIGFCFGGSNAWRQSASALDLAACVGFYGQAAAVGEAASRAAKPTLMLIAGADQVSTCRSQVDLADTMRAAGADVTVVVYEGAPHSFFDRHFDEWADASADAWKHVLALVDRVAGSA
ncbi:MAG: dienelactone hydrolase family protein [Actinomycetota bacterium]|nr:dienelactone hydrolase family protein [Actinomycetota bacterium]